jgi:anti-sigma factor RsiW
MTNCKDCRSHLPDLLLDTAYTAAHPEFKEHLLACAACRAELAELRSTFALLDEWKAPEISPYFDSRLQARLREAVASPPEGFFARMRSYLLFSTGRQFRPAMAGALAFVLLIGGGTFANFYHAADSMPPVADSATVNDLKLLDNNVQAEQQLNQLLDDPAPSANDDAALPTT